MGLGFHFFPAFAFQFPGSVPPGTINLGLVEKSIGGKKRLAVFWAFLARLVGSPYVIIPWLIPFHWLHSPEIFDFKKLVSILILMILGWNSWRNSVMIGEKWTSNLSAFVGLNLLIVSALPFCLIAFQCTMTLADPWIVFWVATILGAFSCLFLCGRLGLSQFPNGWSLLLQKSVAYSFFGQAIWQFFNLLPIF